MFLNYHFDNQFHEIEKTNKLPLSKIKNKNQTKGSRITTAIELL